MSKKPIDTSSLSNELKGASLFFQKPAEVVLQAPAIEQQIDRQDSLAQKDEQVSNPLSKELLTITRTNSRKSTRIGVLPRTEDIETMTFNLRKVRKSKVNTAIAEEWKAELDTIAFELNVGKYELLEFIIGSFLGKLPQNNS